MSFEFHKAWTSGLTKGLVTVEVHVLWNSATTAEAIRAQRKAWIESNVTTLRREFDERARMIPLSDKQPILNDYQPAPKGPCRRSFSVSFHSLGSLALASKSAPDKKAIEDLPARIQVLFAEPSAAPSP